MTPVSFYCSLTAMLVCALAAPCDSCDWRISCLVCFRLCSWRFVFYLTAFLGGLGSLIDVSQPFVQDLWLKKTFVYLAIFGDYPFLPDSLVLGPNRVLEGLPQTGEHFNAPFLQSIILSITGLYFKSVLLSGDGKVPVICGLKRS